MLKCGHIFCLDCIMEEGMNFKNCTSCKPQKRIACLPINKLAEITDFKPIVQSSVKQGIDEAISVDSESSTFDRRIRNMISELESIHFQDTTSVSCHPVK